LATNFLTQDYTIILTQNGLGYTLGDIFTNSSGHFAAAKTCRGIFNFSVSRNLISVAFF
jgi:hypothetical protein